MTHRFNVFVENVLRENGYKYFQSGSRFFGHYRSDSDYDYIVHGDYRRIRNKLNQTGLRFEIPENVEHYPAVVIQCCDVQLCCVESENNFDVMLEEHQFIKHHLTTDMIQMAYSMREHLKIPGSDIYNLFLFTVRTRKQQS